MIATAKYAIKNDVFAITGMPGISAALLIAGKGLWVMDTGFISRPEQRKVDSTTLFYWASVGKMVTATIIATLVQEHKLSYDSKLSDWYPQFQDATKITIDELLKHTAVFIALILIQPFMIANVIMRRRSYLI